MKGLIINRNRGNIRGIRLVALDDSMPAVISKNSTGGIHHQQSSWIVEANSHTRTIRDPPHSRDILRKWGVPIDGTTLMEEIGHDAFRRTIVANRVGIA